MIEMVLLVARSGDFFMDIVLPSLVGAAVLIWLGNTILNKWGYTLW